ncbi:hypothetical protein [Stenotrophomonas muris]|uniref:hypothetical protein n=1 Tax=Stenotrophomonas muris TaxID=2963283 RepID=UPI0040554377
MERDSIFKEHHFRELQRRDSLHSGLSLTIGVATLIVGGLASLTKEIPLGSQWLTKLQFGLAGITALTTLATIFCIARALIGYRYAQFADPRKLFERRKEWLETHDGDESKAQASFNEQVDELYASNAGHNGENNKTKSTWAARANRCLLFSLLGFFLLGSIQLLGSLGKPKEPFQVVLKQPGVVMIQKSEPEKPAPSPEQPATQDKPVPPPLETIYSQDGKLPKPPAGYR